MQKTIKDRKGKSPFMRKLSGTQHRIFQESKILPDTLSCIFNSDTVIVDAIKQGYRNIMEMDYKYISTNQNKPKRKFENPNLSLLIKAFPELNAVARFKFNLD